MNYKEQFRKIEDNNGKLEKKLKRIVFYFVSLSIALTLFAYFIYGAYLLLNPEIFFNYFHKSELDKILVDAGGLLLTTSVWISVVAVYYKEGREVFDEWLARFSKKEKILILGLSERGLQIFLNFSSNKNYQVISVDKQPSHPFKKIVRNNKGLFFSLDAISKELFEVVPFNKVSKVFVLTERDDVNIAIATNLYNFLESNAEIVKINKNIEIFCEIQSNELRRTLGSIYVHSHPVSPMRISSNKQTIARNLISNLIARNLYPPKRNFIQMEINIFGDDSFLTDFCIEISQVGSYLTEDALRKEPHIIKLVVRIFSETSKIDKVKHDLLKLFENISDYIDLDFVDLEGSELRAHSNTLFRNGSLAISAFENELKNYELSNYLAQLRDGEVLENGNSRESTIVTLIQKSPKIYNFVDYNKNVFNSHSDFTYIGYSGYGQTSSAIEEVEAKAARLHNNYLFKLTSANMDNAEASKQPWSRLNSFYRDSNRSFIRNTEFIKSVITNYFCSDDQFVKNYTLQLVLRYDRATTDSELKQVLIEYPILNKLSEIEHQRWMAFYLGQGWRFGPSDPPSRKHACLKPYSELSFYEQKKDIANVITCLREFA